MQALILAAGFGKRLQPITNTIPKCLVEVNGTPLLVNALDNLAGRGISQVIVVVGHKKEYIMQRIGSHYKDMDITYVENPIFDKTNNVYSLFLAKNYVNDDLIMLECDLFYRRFLIDTIIKGTAECNILVSRFDMESMNGSVVKVGDDAAAKCLTIKRDQSAGFDYSNMMKTVNVYKFKKDFVVDRLFPMVEAYVKTQSVQSYYELVIGSLIYFGNNDIKVVFINKSEWCEIDDLQDLKVAESIFSEGQSNE